LPQMPTPSNAITLCGPGDNSQCSRALTACTWHFPCCSPNDRSDRVYEQTEMGRVKGFDPARARIGRKVFGILSSVCSTPLHFILWVGKDADFICVVTLALLCNPCMVSRGKESCVQHEFVIAHDHSTGDSASMPFEHTWPCPDFGSMHSSCREIHCPVVSLREAV
jgi:hypothetical protein